MTVLTALGEVREIGTQFEVALLQGTDGTELVTRVREGAVSLLVSKAGSVDEGSPTPMSVEAAAGEQLTTKDGVVTRSQIAVYGDDWQWVLAGAPSFAVRGRTVTDLLHWLARETGREVSYGSPAAAEAAALPFAGGGTLEPEAALDAVRTVGLSASFEGGKILVVEAGS